MPLPAPLIAELETVIERGSEARRAQALQGIADLFVAGANQFNDDHVQVFDAVLCRLLEDSDRESRIDLARRLAPLGNAPPKVIKRLAYDDDIAVARSVLKQSAMLA
jgi:uncharacterized protein (DUF2336 family)